MFSVGIPRWNYKSYQFTVHYLGCCAKEEIWIQLPCHLYAAQEVDLGEGSSFSQRNETLKGLAQVNIVKRFWYDVKSVKRHYVNKIDR